MSKVNSNVATGGHECAPAHHVPFRLPCWVIVIGFAQISYWGWWGDILEKNICSCKLFAYIWPPYQTGPPLDPGSPPGLLPPYTPLKVRPLVCSMWTGICATVKSVIKLCSLMYINIRNDCKLTIFLHLLRLNSV